MHTGTPRHDIYHGMRAFDAKGRVCASPVATSTAVAISRPTAMEVDGGGGGGGGSGGSGGGSSSGGSSGGGGGSSPAEGSQEGGSESLCELHVLRLSHNPLGEIGVLALASALQTNRSLQSLVLQYVNCNPSEQQGRLEPFPLTPLLTGSAITELDMCHNHIAACGGHIDQLREALDSNMHLRTLSLRRCCIGGWRRARAIARGLALNRSLTSVDLSYNGIDAASNPNPNPEPNPNPTPNPGPSPSPRPRPRPRPHPSPHPHPRPRRNLNQASVRRRRTQGTGRSSRRSRSQSRPCARHTHSTPVARLTHACRSVQQAYSSVRYARCMRAQLAQRRVYPATSRYLPSPTSAIHHRRCATTASCARSVSRTTASATAAASRCCRHDQHVIALRLHYDCMGPLPLAHGLAASDTIHAAVAPIT